MIFPSAPHVVYSGQPSVGRIKDLRVHIPEESLKDAKLPFVRLSYVP